MEKKLIHFLSKEMKKLMDEELTPDNYNNDLEGFLFYKKQQNKYINGRFFIDCSVEFIKGFGNHKEYIKESNCFVSVYGNIAFIQLEDSYKIIKKKVNSRNFYLYGIEVDKSEFDRKVSIAHNRKPSELLESIKDLGS